jgi:hypothetical protein
LVIFCEKEYCEELLKSRNKLNIIQQYDLNYLASYWKDQKLTVRVITENLKNWCLSQDKNYNFIINRNKIKKAILHCKKYSLRSLPAIVITESEVESIKQINDYKYQKLLFMFLVVAKFFKYNVSRKIDKKSTTYFGIYSNRPIKQIAQSAGIEVSKKEWFFLKQELYKAGLIDPTLRGAYNYKINYYNDESPSAIVITDWRNPIAYWQQYCGEKVIQCEDCGMMIVKKSNYHRLCKKCYLKNHREINKINMKNTRNYFKCVPVENSKL